MTAGSLCEKVSAYAPDAMTDHLDMVLVAALGIGKGFAAEMQVRSGPCSYAPAPLTAILLRGSGTGRVRSNTVTPEKIMWTGDVVASKANGERGWIEAVYPTHDGATVAFRSFQALGSLPR